jgi:hypothetical protein
VTVIVPIAKSCHGAKVPAKDIFDSIQDLKNIWPYAVELVVFSYDHPTMDYQGKDCTDFEQEYVKTGRTIHMMKPSSTLNGLDATPIFKIIRDIMQVTELNVYTTQYYLIRPDFDMLEYHYGKSLLDMKDVLEEAIKELDSSKKEL